MLTSYCVACHSTKELNKHHLLPKALGGTDQEDNLITLCKHCHSKIHRLDLTFTSLAKEGKNGTTHNEYNNQIHKKKQEHLKRCWLALDAILKESPHSSYREIAEEMNRRSPCRTFGNKAWTVQSIRKVIKALGIEKPDARKWSYPGKAFHKYTKHPKSPASDLIEYARSAT